MSDLDVYLYGPNGTPVRAGRGTPLVAGGGGGSGLLTWAPPDTSTYTTVNVGTGGFSSTLDHDTDFVLNLPDTPMTNTLMLKGGRNIVVIGGEIAKDDIAYDANGGAVESDQHGIYIVRHPTAGVHATPRIIHLEGIKAAGYGLSDGLRTASNNGGPTDVDLRVQECRFELGMWYRDAGLDGTGTPHGDVLQPFGGIGWLRVDGLTGLIPGQGLMLKADFNGPNQGFMQFRRMNLRENTNPNIEYNDPAATWPRPSGRTPRYFWWTNGTEGGIRLDPGTVHFDHPDRNFDTSGIEMFEPEGGAGGGTYGSDALGTYFEPIHGQGWDGTGSGRVYAGPPAGGDYVPEGVAGIGYTNTAGYAS